MTGDTTAHTTHPDPAQVEHGGTDDGPAPRVDASTNANPYGPSPVARRALDVDLGPYPDPVGTATRTALAEHHGIDVDEVVLGAGATELIDRLVRVVAGPVLTEAVTFGEYAGAARRHGLPHRAVASDELAEAVEPGSIVFVCSPGNPDGRIRDADWCDELTTAAEAADAVLVMDLAYAPLVPEQVPLPLSAVALHAPNKPHGCTGLRAGWLRAPTPLAARLRAAAVTWAVSAPGHAFLQGTASLTADAWVATHTALLRADRDATAAGLRALDLEVVHDAAPFVLVAAPDGWTSRGLAAQLRRDHGVKVRPTDSMGRPGWVRVAALPTGSRNHLVDAVAAMLGRTPPDSADESPTRDEARGTQSRRSMTCKR